MFSYPGFVGTNPQRCIRIVTVLLPSPNRLRWGLLTPIRQPLIPTNVERRLIRPHALTGDGASVTDPKQKGRSDGNRNDPGFPNSQRLELVGDAERRAMHAQIQVAVRGILGCSNDVAGGRVAETDVVELAITIFRTHVPVLVQRILEAGADCPAHLGVVSASFFVELRNMEVVKLLVDMLRELDVGERDTAGDVRKQVAPGPSNSTTNSGDVGCVI